ncbi:VOC family protein [Chloroflexota bacterium]
MAVRDLDIAVNRYSGVLGVQPDLIPPQHYVYPGLKGARFHIGDVNISLVASEKAGSPISRFIETRGEGVNHISLEVDDIEQTIIDLTAQGVRFATDQPQEYPDGKVIFAHPKSFHGVQIALVETNQD